MPQSSAAEPTLWRWAGRLGLLLGAVASLIAILQYMERGRPAEVKDPAPVLGRTEAEVEREIERARRETLEKALKEVAAARPKTDTPPAKAHAPIVVEPDAPVAAAAQPASSEPARPRLDSLSPSVTEAPRAAGPCIPVGRRLADPVSVSVGSQLCAQDGTRRATVHEITSYSVIYSMLGGPRVTCRKTEICSFNWDGAPLFNVDVVEGASAGSRKAVLIDAR